TRSTSYASSFESETKTKSRPVGGEIPAAWLAPLLVLSCELPIEEGPEAVASALVDAVGGILPSHAFGLVLKDDDRSRGVRIIRAAREGSEVGISPNPDRMFPELDHERVLDLRGEHEGIRLHVASDDASSLRDGTPVHFFVKRVGAVLTSALRTTRLVSAKGR